MMTGTPATLVPVSASRTAVVRPARPNNTREVIEPWLATQMLFYHGCLSENISTVSIRREVLEEMEGYGEFAQSGDFDLMARVAARYSLGFLDEGLMEVRVHEGQLSRRDDALVSYVAEQRAIRAGLLERLPDELQSWGRAYHLRRHGLLNMKYLTRILLRGRFGKARALAAEIRRGWSLPRLTLLSLVTLEGRLWKPKPRYVRP